MKPIIKNSFVILMLQLIVLAGYSQDINWPVNPMPSLPGPSPLTLKQLLEIAKKANGTQEKVPLPGSNQSVLEARKKAEAAKILMLGDSYQLTDATWIKLGMLDFKGQCDTLRSLLQANAEARKSAINDASREVFGNGAEPQDFAYWDAKIIKEKKHGYASIVLVTISKLNADKDRRELMIRVAYVTVFGKDATAAELGKWISSTAHYRIIYQSLIAYLYSAEGANNLTAMVKQTFAKKNQQYTDEQLIERMMVAKAQKMDFMKMANSF